MTNNEMNYWNENHVSYPRETATEIVDEFDLVLSDARDEKPLQTFLAANPPLISPLAPPGNTYWCLDRPRLGSEYIPDFLLASRTSVGIQWAMIELESPLENIMTKTGVPAKKTAEGLKQIRDWRAWLRDNISYARTELGLTDIDAECNSYLVIGRRSNLKPSQIKQYRELSDNKTIVMTYDRLRDAFGRNFTISGDLDG